LTHTHAMVGIGELQISKEESTFHCIGLGSCIAACIVDPEAKVSGVAHFMLPMAFENGLGDRPAKFVDTGLPHFIDQIEKAGGSRSRLKAALVGGAQVLHGKTVSSTMEFGARNAQALRELLASFEIPIVATDLGGNQGRSMTYDSRSGNITVRTAALPDRLIGNLL